MRSTIRKTSSSRRKTLRNVSRITVITMLTRTWIIINHVSMITLRITLMRSLLLFLRLNINIITRNFLLRIYYILILRIREKNILVGKQSAFFVTSSKKFLSSRLIFISSKKLSNRSLKRIILKLITLFIIIITL